MSSPQRNLILVLVFLCSLCQAGIVDTLYEKVRKAQDTGSYLKLLKSLSHKGTKSEVEKELVEILDQVKKLPSEQRKTVIQEILFYYSKSNNTHKQTPLMLDTAVTTSKTNLEAGKFSSKGVAKELLSRVIEYEKKVSIPIYEQVRQELAEKFPGRQIFFIGRDFTAAQIWAAQTDPQNAARYHTANTSRAVKDAIHEGETAPMRELLSQIGLDPQSMVKDGIVFVDSSMAGKIPMAILKAVTEKLDGKKAFQLLSNANIIYLKSSQKDGTPLSEVVQEKANKGALSKAAIAELLEHRAGIPEFDLKLPNGYSHYAGNKHHLAEHRPKFLVSTTGFSDENYGMGLKTEKPKDLGVIFRSLLGLYADLVLLEEAENKVSDTVSPKNPKANQLRNKTKTESARLDSNLDQQLRELAKSGDEALKQWQDAHDNSAQAEFNQVKVVNTNDKKFPFELVVGGQKRMRLVRKLGEGNNIVAYLTENGTALKVAKQPQFARKNILGVWMQSFLEDYRLPHAKVLSMSPAGIYVEQEYAPLGDLETLFGHSDEALPKSIRTQVVDQWKKAYDLAKKEGIWLDFKAANYSLGADGKILLLDYVPRLNSSKTRFFRDGSGKKLSEDKIVDLFLHYQIQKGSSKAESPKDPEIGHKILKGLKQATVSSELLAASTPEQCWKLIQKLEKK